MSGITKQRFDMETYDALVSATYDAAQDPALWGKFLGKLAQAFNGHGASLRLLDAQSYYPCFNAVHGYDKAFTQAYTEHYYQTDVSIPFLEQADPGTVTARSEHMSDKDYRNTEYYQDFGRHWRINDLLGGYFIKSQKGIARVGVHRPVGAPTFDDEDKSRMSLLMPHLRRAFHISRHIQSIQAQHDASSYAFDHLPFGVVFVDRIGKPMIVNKQAEAISRGGRGIRINAEGIRTGSSKSTQTLRHLIQQAIAGSKGRAYRGGAMSVKHNSACLPLSLIITPLNATQPVFGFEDEQAAAIVFISDPTQEQRISPEILSILYGLTRAEARLAKELAMGKTLDDISDTYRLSKHTLRAQLKTTFSKTGLSRQAELIRLVIGGPAALHLDS